MNHAFLIQAHSQFQLLKLIVDILDAPNHFFYIHIDLKARKEMYQTAEIDQLLQKENVVIYSQHKVNWGGSNQFIVSLELLKKALQQIPQCNYFHLISGADLPLKDKTSFDLFFKNDLYSYLGVIPKEDTIKYKDRYSIYYLRDFINLRSNRIMKCFCRYMEGAQKYLLKLNINLRPNLKHDLYKGSNWWSINYKVALYIVDYLEKNPTFLKRFKYTDCCDEIFFHIIIMNSHYKDYIINNNLRYIDWTPKYPNAPVPNILTEKDWPNIKKSNALFCRKIDLKLSRGLIEIIKAKYLTQNNH